MSHRKNVQSRLNLTFTLPILMKPYTSILVCKPVTSQKQLTIAWHSCVATPLHRATPNSTALSALNSFRCAQGCCAAPCSLGAHWHRCCAIIFVVYALPGNNTKESTKQDCLIPGAPRAVSFCQSPLPDGRKADKHLSSFQLQSSTNYGLLPGILPLRASAKHASQDTPPSMIEL